MIRVELPALIGRLNDISRQALEASAALCISRQGAEITPAHLLFKLLETPFSDVRQILEHTGINHQQLQPLVGDSLNGEPQTAEPYPSFSPLLARASASFAYISAALPRSSALAAAFWLRTAAISLIAAAA